MEPVRYAKVPFKNALIVTNFSVVNKTTFFVIIIGRKFLQIAYVT